jgi:hypothetical protein
MVKGLSAEDACERQRHEHRSDQDDTACRGPAKETLERRKNAAEERLERVAAADDDVAPLTRPLALRTKSHARSCVSSPLRD